MNKFKNPILDIKDIINAKDDFFHLAAKWSPYKKMTHANKGFCVKQNVIVMLCFKHRTSNTSSWERAQETCELMKIQKPPSTLQYLGHHTSLSFFLLPLFAS